MDGHKGMNRNTAWSGILISIAAVAGGFALERGRILDLASFHSLVIVIGGTMGAVLVGTPYSTLMAALHRSRRVFQERADELPAAAERILRYAAMVRRAGAGSLEAEAEAMEHGFLRRALLLIVDGVQATEIRRQLEAHIVAEEEDAESVARVFEQAGGYAPTIGIIGAVIGLIQVMRQLGNPDEVGRGIAAAFISTLYGVALANLLLLPVAARIRSRAMAESRVGEMMLEGLTAIAEGLSLHVLRSRLEPYVNRKESAAANRSHSAMPVPIAARRTA